MQTSFYSQILEIASDTSFSCWEAIFKAPLTMNSFKVKKKKIGWEKHRSKSVCGSSGAQTTSVGKPPSADCVLWAYTPNQDTEQQRASTFKGSACSQPRST